MTNYRLTELIYENPLASEADVEGFQLEGQAHITFPRGCMRMENALDPELGQEANFVFWCPEDFPPDIAVSWAFTPIREPGLCILFFAATGREGEDLFDPSLQARMGEYRMYHHGDINAFHLSYFRRRHASERAFHTCNLRKSYGFHMTAQGADPIPSVQDATPPYNIQLIKCGPEVAFTINELPLLHFKDDGETYGPLLKGGKIGFRQMAPLMAEYANLKVHAVKKQ